MRQFDLGPQEEQKRKVDSECDRILQRCRETSTEVQYGFSDKIFDDAPEEREKFYAELFEYGGLKPLLSTQMTDTMLC